MFDYTRALLIHTIKQIKEIAFAISALVHTVTVVYLIYALCVGNGNLFANISLLVISLFLLGYIIYKSKHKVDKQTNKQINRYAKYVKRAIKLYEIVPLIVIILTSDTTNPLTFLTVILSALMLAVQILLDILILVIDKRVDLFKEAFDNDIDEFKKPFTATGDFFKKIVGKEVEEKPKSKHFDFLANLVGERKQTKKQEKAEKKAMKKQERQAKKQALLEEELAVTNEDKNA